MPNKGISEIIQSIRDTRVLVIGDIMLDRYLRGRADRVSPEADVPILDHEQTTTKLGGAANVALNFKSLGCEVKLVSITGQDESANEMEGLLKLAQIEHTLVRCNDRPTTIKTRVIASDKHLLRVDFEQTRDIDSVSEQQVLDAVSRSLETFQPQIIVFQDYNKGLLTTRIIKRSIAMGKEVGAYLCVDPKERNFWAYAGVDLFKPNLREIETALGRKLENIESWLAAATEVKKRLDAVTVALTLGSHGIILVRGSDHSYQESLPIEVVDVCGAGDAVLTVVSLLLWKGQGLDIVGGVGNYVGGQVCQFSGVKIVGLDMLDQLPYI